jgi:hypothetical protein
MKSEKLILAEIKALETVLPRIKRLAPATIFGDDNVAGIEAQIKVLKERMNSSDIYEEWQDQTDEEYIMDAARDALNWMNESSKDRPSVGWKQLADGREKRTGKAPMPEKKGKNNG